MKYSGTTSTSVTGTPSSPESRFVKNRKAHKIFHYIAGAIIIFTVYFNLRFLFINQRKILNVNMEVSESNSIQAPPKRVVQEEIEDDDSQILEEGMLPSCKDKWSGMFDPYSYGFINLPKDMQPLPPFTSGDAPICSLNSSADSPIPVILISKGRSGSSSTWQVMSRLTGHCFKCEEYPGENHKYQEGLLSRNTPTNNGNWILGYLCSQQKAFKNKRGIIGFKWKPDFFSDTVLNGLRMIAHYTNPQIKIILSRRNALDVILSISKHEYMNEHKQEMRSFAHCSSIDTICIEAHKKFGSGLYIPVEHLLNKLIYMSNFESKLDDYLEEFNVSHIKVTYEKLYYSKDAEEWMRIFRFIGRGPRSKLTKSLVEKAMQHVGTSNSFHNETIKNYEEVRDTLVGTQFETLLH